MLTSIQCAPLPWAMASASIVLQSYVGGLTLCSVWGPFSFQCRLGAGNAPISASENWPVRSVRSLPRWKITPFNPSPIPTGLGAVFNRAGKPPNSITTRLWMTCGSGMPLPGARWPSTSAIPTAPQTWFPSLSAALLQLNLVPPIKALKVGGTNNLDALRRPMAWSTSIPMAQEVGTEILVLWIGTTRPSWCFAEAMTLSGFNGLWSRMKETHWPRMATQTLKIATG